MESRKRTWGSATEVAQFYLKACCIQKITCIKVP